jgi:hypothetical protein
MPASGAIVTFKRAGRRNGTMMIASLQLRIGEGDARADGGGLVRAATAVPDACADNGRAGLHR